MKIREIANKNLIMHHKLLEKKTRTNPKAVNKKKQ
jgi:hypothetical protein